MRHVLQRQLFRHPESLPVNEIEPNLGPLVPLCMEMASANGYMGLPVREHEVDRDHHLDQSSVALLLCQAVMPSKHAVL